MLQQCMATITTMYDSFRQVPRVLHKSALRDSKSSHGSSVQLKNGLPSLFLLYRTATSKFNHRKISEQEVQINGQFF